MYNHQYFNPYKANRTAIINKHSFYKLKTPWHKTVMFKILKGKQTGIVYWVRSGLIRSYNDYRYNPWDMRYMNRRKYLTNWPSLRYPIRCYTSNTRCYAFKNNIKKYKEKMTNLQKEK